jgi:DNA-directed RNA polymerase subunit RPC12/RpoP
MIKKTQEVRIYTKAREITTCFNCPSLLLIKGTKDPIVLRCGELTVKEEVHLDIFPEDKTKFPEFCPLKPTGKTENGLKTRLYPKPSVIYFCLNCPSAKIDATKTPIRYTCTECKGKGKQIYVMDVFYGNKGKCKFPEFCPLEQTTREKFEKKRGW